MNHRTFLKALSLSFAALAFVGLPLCFAASQGGNTLPPSSRTGSRPAVFRSREHCQPLPPPTGHIVTVSTVAELVDAVNNARSGDTILLQDGTYNLDGLHLRFDTPNVTLRSASGNREAVIIDGNGSTTEIVQIVASDVTIADVTLQRAYNHPIHVMSTAEAETTGTLIYNVHIIDPGEQAIKINPYTGEDARHFPDGGIIACSHIELTAAGRANIRNDCYTGGVDAHQARDWIIRDNLIEGFWCTSGLAEHAVHFWRASRDTLVERNELRNNARGVGFGMATEGDNLRTYADHPCPQAGGYVDHYGGIVRNNIIFANDEELFASEYGFDCGICLWNACGARVLHNTVVSTRPPFSSIEWRFERTEVAIVNNLLSHNLRDRGGTASLSGNLSGQPLSLFVDGNDGDLHLADGANPAIDSVALPPDVADDIDGDARPIGPAADVGADEYGIPAPQAVRDLRVRRALTDATTLTATLTWSPPDGALTTTLRYTRGRITEENWATATLLTDALTGAGGRYTATVPYAGGVVHFALKTANEGGRSPLSNNGFWPALRLCLPVILK